MYSQRGDYMSKALINCVDLSVNNPLSGDLKNQSGIDTFFGRFSPIYPKIIDEYIQDIYRHEYGYAKLSQHRIASDLGYTREVVGEVVRSALKHGILKRQQSDGRYIYFADSYLFTPEGRQQFGKYLPSLLGKGEQNFISGCFHLSICEWKKNNNAIMCNCASTIESFGLGSYPEEDIINQA